MLTSVMLRANLSLVHMELRGAVDFYEHTDQSFEKHIKAFEAQIDKRPGPYWKEEIDEGYTRGDLISEQHTELLGLSELTGYFGVTTVYAVLERFLFHIFKCIKEFGLAVPPKFSGKNWLDFAGYARVLKANGLDITASPFQYSELIKLREMRHAIAHFGGWVTEDNEQIMRNYGYKVGCPITVSDEYFRSSVVLVGATCEEVTNRFAPILKKHLKQRPK